MAVTNRSGAQGTGVALGKQTAYGTPVKVRTDMTSVLFPVSAITLDEDADIEESNLITAFGAAPPVEIGQLAATGGFTTRILPEFFSHILEGILNPTKNSSVALAEGALGSVAAGTVTITNASYPGHGTPVEDVGYPSRIKFTAITGDGTIKIKGKRRAGRQHASGDDRLATFDQEETITVASGETTAESVNYYSSVIADGITVDGITAATIAWDPNTYKTTVQFQATDPEFPGYTALLLKGGIPNVVTDWVPGEMAIAAGPDGIDVTMTGVGTRYEEFRTISTEADFDTPKYALETADTQYYHNPPIKSFPGWAGALSFGGEIVKYTSIDFNINRNYENDPGVDGVRFKYGVTATGNRLVTFNPTTYLRAGDATDTFLRLQEIFRNGTREELIMRNLAYDSDGYQNRMDWKCESAQISESPRAEVTGPGPIERRVPFRALPATGSAAEIIVTMWTKARVYS